MKENTFSAVYKVYDSINELNPHDQRLLQDAQKASESAYAPYSNFQVGATLGLANGTTINGSNQENASFPVGICAERVALSALAAAQHNTTVNTIAIYCNNQSHQSPAAPCGMCRQALFEQQQRQKSNIRILLKGNAPEIIEISSVDDILPLGFSGKDL